MKSLVLLFLLITQGLYAQDTAKVSVARSEPIMYAKFPGNIGAYVMKVQNGIVLQDADSAVTRTSKIFISFIVDTTGKAGNVSVVYYGFDKKLHDYPTDLLEQYKKGFSTMPLWSPCVINGQKQEQKFTIPITIDYK